MPVYSGCEVTGSRQDLTLLVCPNLVRDAIDNVVRNAIHDALAGMQIRLDCSTDGDTSGTATRGPREPRDE